MSQARAEETLRVWREAAPFCEKYAPTIRAMFAPLTDALVEEARIGRVLEAAGAKGERVRVLKFHIEAPISPSEFWELRSETSDTLRGNWRGSRRRRESE